MAADPTQAIAAARALLGTPFRLQGRDATGLDCVGLIAAAYDLTAEAPRAYRLRGTPADRAALLLDGHFRRRRNGAVHVGDIVMLSAGPAQLHLGLWTGASLIHAHAGLRRVVETPGPIAQPLVGIWFRETN